MPDWLHPSSQDFWQVGAWIVAIIGGLIAAFKAIYEMQKSRQQREREFAWNQAREAAAVLNQLDTNSAAKSAVLMLDWSSRDYSLPTGKVVVIDKKQVHRALRTTELDFLSQRVSYATALMPYSHT